MLAVGIGEVVMPQLAKRNNVPLPVAAATSLYVVIVVGLAAAITQIGGLMMAGGNMAMPWNLAIYAVPAVLIGGQFGPGMLGKVRQQTMELFIGILFAIIAVAMFAVVWRD